MAKPSFIDALTISGLSEREALVWHALMTEGASNISELARATELHRPALYELLPSLIEKKLVKEVTTHRRVAYRATGTRALEMFRASRDVAYAKELKRLKKFDAQPDVSEDVRVYHGKEMRKVWEDVLASTPQASVFYRYDGYAPPIHAQDYMPKDYYARIEHKKIDRFVITNGALRKSAYKKRLECASRMLPKSFDAFEQGVSQFIFGDKLALIDFKTETAIVITNKTLAKYHAKLFQYLYRSLPE